MAMPLPSGLAALGAVLCLYRAQHGGELAGWSRAVRATACSDLDSDGLREQVMFFDRDDRCCWRLYLLPDSDFMAWEDMVAGLPRAAPAAAVQEGIGERLWRGLAGRLGERWQAAPLRLHALAAARCAGEPLPGGDLAASLAVLSPLGDATARSIAREQRVVADGIAGPGAALRPAPVPAPAFPRVGGDNVIQLSSFTPGVRA